MPHISNYTDFLSLENDSQVNLHYLQQPRNLEGYDIVLLPGSKNVRSDLKWIKSGGWEKRLFDYAENSGEIGGICGGYQILGRVIHDPEGVEDLPGRDAGLGLLDLETTLASQKVLSRSSGVWQNTGDTIEGYEIHVGLTKRGENQPPVIEVNSRNGIKTNDTDGAISPNRKIWGTYFHGLFNNRSFRLSFLQRIFPDYHPESIGSGQTINEFRDRQYDLLADHFRKYLDLDTLQSIIGI